MPFTNSKSRFAAIIFEDVIGPLYLAPNAYCFTCISVGPETRLEARIQALEALSAQKAPVGVSDQDGVNKRE